MRNKSVPRKLLSKEEYTNENKSKLLACRLYDSNNNNKSISNRINYKNSTNYHSTCSKVIIKNSIQLKQSEAAKKMEESIDIDESMDCSNQSLSNGVSTPSTNTTSSTITTTNGSKMATEFHLPPPPVQTTARGGTTSGNGGRRPKGRLKRSKNKKTIKNITGLDLLHAQTLLSTTTTQGKKLPPAPGCVDQKLTQLTTAASNGIIKHEELSQPISRDTPYALQKLLDMLRNQYLDAVESMKSSSYKTNLESQITVEKKRKEELMLRKSQLEKQIAKLIEDSTLMLRAKLDELQIPIPDATGGADALLSEARNIVLQHKEMQAEATKLQDEVEELERKEEQLTEERTAEIIEEVKGQGFIDFVTPETEEMVARRYLINQIGNTLNRRKQLESKLSSLENDIGKVQRSVMMTQQQQQLILHEQQQHQQNPQHFNPQLPQEKQQHFSKSQSSQSTPNSNSNSNNTVAVVGGKKNLSRTRSTEWPDIPDIGKINENNPEVLARKILETGRKIEAGKVQSSSNNNNLSSGSSANMNSVHNSVNSIGFPGAPPPPGHHPQHAPAVNGYSKSMGNSHHPSHSSVSVKEQQQHHHPHPHQIGKRGRNSSSGSLQLSPGASRDLVPSSRDNSVSYPMELSSPNNNNPSSMPSLPAPKVNFYEDRLHSLITTCLNDAGTSSSGPSNNNNHPNSNPNPNHLTAFGPTNPSNSQQQQQQHLNMMQNHQHHSNHPPPPPRPCTPPRTPSSEVNLTKKQKKLQLSPDIINGVSHGQYVNHQVVGGSVANVNSVKKALRQHLNLQEPKSSGGSNPNLNPNSMLSMSHHGQTMTTTVNLNQISPKGHDKSHNHHHPPPQQQQQQHPQHPQQRYAKTMDDYLSAEIVSGLGYTNSNTNLGRDKSPVGVGGGRGGKGAHPNISPPIRAVYSPISRPNSNENIPESLAIQAAFNSMNNNINHHNNNNNSGVISSSSAPGGNHNPNTAIAYAGRASVLVKATSSSINSSNSGSTEMGGMAVEGLAGVLKSSKLLQQQQQLQQSPSKSSSAINGFLGASNSNGTVEVLKKVKKVIENPNSGLTTVEVVLGTGVGSNVNGSCGEPDLFNNGKSGEAMSSVLQVSRKRLCDPNPSGMMVPLKKQSMGMSHYDRDRPSSATSSYDGGPPKTPTPTDHSGRLSHPPLTPSPSHHLSGGGNGRHHQHHSHHHSSSSSRPSSQLSATSIPLNSSYGNTDIVDLRSSNTSSPLHHGLHHEVTLTSVTTTTCHSSSHTPNGFSKSSNGGGSNTGGGGNHNKPPTPNSLTITPTEITQSQGGGSSSLNASSSSVSHAPRVDSPTKQWQNKISSNFERLFCFANEVDKRRRSTENNSNGSSPRNSSSSTSNVSSSHHHHHHHSHNNANNSSSTTSLTLSSPPTTTTTATNNINNNKISTHNMTNSNISGTSSHISGKVLSSSSSPRIIKTTNTNVESDRPKTPSGSMDCTTSPDSGIGIGMKETDIWLNGGGGAGQNNNNNETALSLSIVSRNSGNSHNNNHQFPPRTPSPSNDMEDDDGRPSRIPTPGNPNNNNNNNNNLYGPIKTEKMNLDDNLNSGGNDNSNDIHPPPTPKIENSQDSNSGGDFNELERPTRSLSSGHHHHMNNPPSTPGSKIKSDETTSNSCGGSPVKSTVKRKIQQCEIISHSFSCPRV